MGLDFWPTSLGFPIVCVRTIISVISKSRCSFVVVRHRSSVFSFLFSGMPCINKQLRLGHCSYLSTWLERLSNCLDLLVKLSSNVLILSCFSFLSFSYSSNWSEIKSIASVNSAKCVSPLICPFFSSFLFSKICVIYLSTFLIHLNKVLTQSGDFKLSVNTSFGISLGLLVSRLPSFNFLLLSSWFQLSLRSRFFEFRSKHFVISVTLMIIPTYSNSIW